CTTISNSGTGTARWSASITCFTLRCASRKDVKPARRQRSSTRKPQRVPKKGGFARSFGLRRGQECASKARVTYGGRFHPDSCRLIWKLTSGSAGQPAGSEARDKGRLGRSSDPAGCNASEVRAGLERVDADADPSFAWGRPCKQGSNRHTHL